MLIAWKSLPPRQPLLALFPPLSIDPRTAISSVRAFRQLLRDGKTVRDGKSRDGKSRELFSGSCDSAEPPELPSLYRVARTEKSSRVAHKLRLTDTVHMYIIRSPYRCVPARRDSLFGNSIPTRRASEAAAHGCRCSLAEQCSARSTLRIAHFIHRLCTQWTELAPFRHRTHLPRSL